MPAVNFLSIPRELRDEIWNLVFHGVTISPFQNNNRDWFFHPARQQCHACPNAGSDDYPSSKRIFAPLLTCKQMYHEAYAVFQKSVCLQISKPGELEDIRQSTRTALRSNLRNLKLVVHLNDNSRDQWMRELLAVPLTFPSLARLDIHSHMRPPTSFQNLSDSIYLACPVVQYPSKLVHLLHFAYVEDDEMFSSEELGTVYYHDALEAHAYVIRMLMKNSQFIKHAQASSFDSMINDLMSMARSQEDAWLESIRRKRRLQAEAAAAQV